MVFDTARRLPQRSSTSPSYNFNFWSGATCRYLAVAVAGWEGFWSCSAFLI